MNVRVRYLYNSGFAVQTARHLLVFDYYLDRPRDGGPEQGVLRPRDLRGQNAVVFASHAHHDHFNPVIFSWREENPDLRYVLSDDIRVREKALFVGPGEAHDLDGLRVETLESTDQGVAFLVETEGLTLYHAGDLNWWHWEGEPEEDNADMARRYREQLDRLAGRSIDLAFVPVDPRLEDAAFWGADLFLKRVGAGVLIPMHFTEDPSVCARLLGDPGMAEYRDRIRPLTRRGETLELEL